MSSRWRKHGHTAGARGSGRRPSKTYSVWNEMRARCRNPRHKRYADYGGRGVTVCARWDDFSKFLLDMGEAPAGMTLDRQNNDRGYNKQNCRWLDRGAQARNTRKNVIITYRGKSACVSEWARATGVNVSTLAYRIRSGWSAQDALFTKPQFSWRQV